MFASILLVVIGFGWLCLLAAAAEKPHSTSDKALGFIAIMIHLTGIVGLMLVAFK